MLKVDRQNLKKETVYLVFLFRKKPSTPACTDNWKSQNKYVKILSKVKKVPKAKFGQTLLLQKYLKEKDERTSQCFWTGDIRTKVNVTGW